MSGLRCALQRHAIDRVSIARQSLKKMFQQEILMSIDHPISASSSIQVTLKLFSIYQDAYGQPEQIIKCPVGTTVGNLCDRLIAEHPSLLMWRSVTRFGINLDFVPEETVLKDGDEVVLIPPVSGGMA